MIRRSFLFAASVLFSASLVHADPKHGIAMQGDPALPPDFKNLPYVNPDAPQGGQLRCEQSRRSDETRDQDDGQGHDEYLSASGKTR